LESITDNYPQKAEPWKIELEVEKVDRLLGIKIPNEEIKKILTNLGIETSEVGEKIICIIPTRRIDLKNQEDLIEEIGRIFGYERIKVKPLKEKVQTPRKNIERELERKIKNILAYCGMDEIKGYSFCSRKESQALGLNDENHITLMNPMSPDQELLRRTLVGGILRSGKKSLSYFEGVRIFETGRVYSLGKDILSREKMMVAGAIIEKGEKGEQFFALKGILENLLHKLGVRDIVFVNKFNEDESDVLSLHNSRKALIENAKGENLGVIGEITRSAHKYYGIKKMRACVFELDMEALLKEIEQEKIYVQLDKFPSVNRDISMIVEEKTLAWEIESRIKKSAGKLLRELKLFDNFVNPESKERSMAFHLVFIDKERTLTAQEVDEKIDQIIKDLEDESGVKVKKSQIQN